MLASSLVGRLLIELVNGQVREVVVTQVILTPKGEPIILLTENDVYYNWYTIIAVKNVSTPQERAPYN